MLTPELHGLGIVLDYLVREELAELTAGWSDLSTSAVTWVT
jgi:hypothetical protein